ncbi:OmpH family outer membrane protein [Candidatus Pelagibacter sp. HIMB1587]|uniref:OmpH family outer membrane protein n=1 Tax=Candidatus Pelagibacter sp. HIMB1587 TaxID=3413354 RepID=UPI003F82D647
MRLFNNLYIFLFIFLSIQNISFAEQSVKFVNVDLLVNKTEIGNQMLDKISNLDKENIKKLKTFERQIKETQEEIKLKKNVISELEFEKELNDLNKKISDFNNQKKIMVDKLTDVKNKELNLFFENVRPLVQNYMNEKSIDIIINSNNIFMGNKNSDISNDLIDIINAKF